MGGSVALGNMQIKGLLDDDGVQKEATGLIPLGGTLGMGFNVSLTPNTTMDFSLVSFPGLAGFTTVTYTF